VSRDLSSGTALAAVNLVQTGVGKSQRRPDVQHTSIYVPKVAYRKIREIANTEGSQAARRHHGEASI